MKTIKHTQLTLLPMAAAIATILAGQAHAQSNAGQGSGGQLEEVVVTAERRAESLQDTSLSLQVLGSDELEQRGLGEPGDLTLAVPGLQVSGDSSPQFYIRGVGDYGVTAVTNPAVSVYRDNVYIARPQGIAGTFYDLERVEVLRGPQGTLYGRNASGGVINLISARPHFEGIEGKVNLEVGNYDHYLSNGAVNLPLGDTFALRFAGEVASRDGYLSDGGTDDEHESLRLRGLWTPSERLSLLLGGDYTHTGGNGSGYVVASGVPGQSDEFIGVTDKRAVDYLQSLPPLGVPQGLENYPGVIASPSPSDLGQDTDIWSVFGELNVDLGEVATLTVLPSYQSSDIGYVFLPGNIANFGQKLSDATRAEAGGYDPGSRGIESDAWSTEIRLSGETSRLNWVAGGYYYKEEIVNDLEVYSGFVQHILIGSELETESYAAFGQVDFSLTDAFRLQAGMRYTNDERVITDGTNYGIYPSLTCAPFDPAPPPDSRCLIADFAGDESFSKTTWRVGVEYDLSDDSMLFANVSTGFKAGGLSEAADFVEVGAALPYDPETVTAYTVGSRNTFLDNTLQLNIEGFYWDYEGLQVNQLIIDRNGNVALGIQNAEEARVFGANVDLVALPYDNGTLRLAVEYLDSEYKDFSYIQSAAFTRPGSNTACDASISTSQPPPVDGPLAGVPFFTLDCSGYEMIRAPKWSGTGSFTHVIPMSTGAEIALSGDVSFGSSRWLDQSFIANARAPSYTVFGARAAYTAPDGRYSIAAYVRNITDEVVYTGGQQNPFVDGFVTSTVLAPKTYGASLQYLF